MEDENEKGEKKRHKKIIKSKTMNSVKVWVENVRRSFKECKSESMELK